jgi:hypothetical protein
MMMCDADIALFAELTLSRFGPAAAAEAARRAIHFERQGDQKNAAAWRRIGERLREPLSGRYRLAASV